LIADVGWDLELYIYRKGDLWIQSDSHNVRFHHEKKISFVFVSAEHTFFVTSDDEVYGVGAERDGLLFPNGGTRDLPLRLRGDFDRRKGKIVQIAGGSSHMIALTDRGELIGCGSSVLGQLGTGDV
jgi:alpha-tubulin suppressor-like RCC1 family protein